MKAATLDELLASGRGAEHSILSSVFTGEELEEAKKGGSPNHGFRDLPVSWERKANGQQRSPRETQRARQGLVHFLWLPTLAQCLAQRGP